MTAQSERLRRDALAIYDAAVLGVEPRHALARALATTPPPVPVFVIAVGKAAAAMATGAVLHLADLEVPLLGGVVVTPEGIDPLAPRPPGDPRLIHVLGDHPLPGPRSAAAADLIGTTVRMIGPRDEVWVLLSGGTSSLIGAPADGLGPEVYRQVCEVAFRAGLDIGELNRIRKRFSRWGAGRLMRALVAERVRVFALSDVAGDEPADIGSGPCEPDPTSASEIRHRMDERSLLGSLPPEAAHWLERVERGDLVETPKADDPIFARRITRIIASNQLAVRHAADRAGALGYQVETIADSIVGAARDAGERFATDLLAATSERPRARIGGGETTVRLDQGAGQGGRCQEFALAAAGVLAGAGPVAAVVLAAGTDGRDGPTDAAGALVDARSWDAIARLGRDPLAALVRHDAYPALDAGQCLLRTGLSGTNVMDLMIGLIARAESDPSAAGSRGPAES
ncbi:MAG: glycerate kinase [Gemmatimonadales bacterium]